MPIDSSYCKDKQIRGHGEVVITQHQFSKVLQGERGPLEQPIETLHFENVAHYEEAQCLQIERQ